MKYFQFVLGCQQNYAEAEKISAILQSIGYQESNEEKADLIIVVACSVRQKAVDRIWGKIKKWHSAKYRKRNRKYIIFGCVLKKDKLKIKKSFDLILGSADIAELPKYLRKIGLKTQKISTPDRVPSSKIGYVSIGLGCNNYCSYCVVPYTRGKEIYFTSQDILSEIKELIKKGCTEIMLLAQNVNSYKSGQTDFVELLKMVNSLEGDFKISFLSPHPKDTTLKLIKTIAKLEKVKKEIHLPVQSGDDEILKKMNRHYSAQSYLKLVQNIRKHIPTVFLSTDIIVGFPTETEKQFQNTVRLVKKAKFNKAFVSQYSPRAGTLSVQKYPDDISSQTKKYRWQVLNNLINES